YNNYQLSSDKVKYKDLIKPGHLNPEYTRYEKHRVWVVEATLKDGVRHAYGKRVFYLDEDTWGIAVADLYDQTGELWRVSMAYINLQSKRYYVQGMDNEEGSTIDYSQEPPGERYFTPAELRRRGKR